MAQGSDFQRQHKDGQQIHGKFSTPLIIREIQIRTRMRRRRILVRNAIIGALGWLSLKKTQLLILGL